MPLPLFTYNPRSPPSQQILYQIHHALPHSHTDVARDGRRRRVLQRLREGVHRYGYFGGASVPRLQPPPLPPTLPPTMPLTMSLSPPTPAPPPPAPPPPSSHSTAPCVEAPRPQQRLRTRHPPASQSFTLLPNVARPKTRHTYASSPHTMLGPVPHAPEVLGPSHPHTVSPPRYARTSLRPATHRYAPLPPLQVDASPSSAAKPRP